MDSRQLARHIDESIAHVRETDAYFSDQPAITSQVERIYRDAEAEYNRRRE